MKKHYFIILLIVSLLLPGCFTKWETKDKLLFTGFVGLHAIDTAQSWDIWEDSACVELNPCITSQEELIAVKLLGVGIVYFAAKLVPKYRTKILTIGCGIQGGAVAWNFTQ